MKQEHKLPPLPDESLDGYREEASIHRDKPLEKTCTHKDIKLISPTEIRCGCGVGYTSDTKQIQELLNLFKS
jgi:hypothetical protein